MSRSSADIDSRRRTQYINELKKHPMFDPKMLEPPKPKFQARYSLLPRARAARAPSRRLLHAPVLTCHARLRVPDGGHAGRADRQDHQAQPHRP